MSQTTPSQFRDHDKEPVAPTQTAFGTVPAADTVIVIGAEIQRRFGTSNALAIASSPAFQELRRRRKAERDAQIAQANVDMVQGLMKHFEGK